MKINKGMHIHFVGIGGIGMSAAAALSLERGVTVTGCDLQRNRYARKMEEAGCQIWYHHESAHLDGVDMVVYSSAIAPENPELVHARNAGIPVYKRAIYTLMLMSDQKLIGIAGSHGKTTTTWMTAHTFINAGVEPSMMVGGTVPELYGNFRIGSGEWFISEVDESDGTLTEISPDIAVVTNIDAEHMAFYKDMATLENAFRTYCENVQPGGTLIINGDDPVLRKIAADCDCTVLTYGLNEPADIRAENILVQDLHVQFDIICKGERIADVRLAFCGEHNILNSLAAFGAAFSGGLGKEDIVRSLESCRPVARRFEMAGKMDDVICINDYAHHPTEVKAVMRAVELHLEQFRKVYVFQPHRYTRLRDCWDNFLLTLNTTNILIVLPVYTANEEPIEGYTSRRLVELLCEAGVKAEHVKDSLLCSHLDTLVEKGDCVVFMGAGDIGERYSEYSERFSR